MMRRLHREGGDWLHTEFLKTAEVQSFIQAHAEVLDSTFSEVEMSDAMRQSLQASDYIFSGMKTFHELNEAFPSLLDDDGQRKPFGRFYEDVRAIDSRYNRNYLRAEYNFAHAAGHMAARWEQIERDGDRYDLQYRTAGDGKVRASHAALDGVTLPPSDPFWKIYYPPNGWNCRCTAVQVRKDKYPRTPSDEAMLRGAEATANDKRGIFRFNAGQQRKVFPDYNPYTIRQCRSCDVPKGSTALTRRLVPNNQVCAACKQIRKDIEERNRKSELKRIEENRKLYDKLSKDKRYKNVEFDPETGALKATHLGHNEGSDLGFVLERKLVDALYKNGHSIILCDEQKKGKDGNILTSLDMILDGVRMDIKSITKNKDFYGSALLSKNAQLLRFNARSDVHEKADSICIYFDDPTMFAPEKITKGYEYMVEKTSQDIILHHIVCVINSAKGIEIKTFNYN